MATRGISQPEIVVSNLESKRSRMSTEAKPENSPNIKLDQNTSADMMSNSAL